MSSNRGPRGGGVSEDGSKSPRGAGVSGTPPSSGAKSSSRPPPSSRAPQKESSFLKKIGQELSQFGVALNSKPTNSRSAPPPMPSRGGTPTSERRSHRPAPKVPRANNDNEAFPGVKLRSRETLMPSTAETSAIEEAEDEPELDEADFQDLKDLLNEDVEEPTPVPDDDEAGDQMAEEVNAPPLLNVPERTSVEMEKDLARMSLSDFVPQEEAPAPPQKKNKTPLRSAPATPGGMSQEELEKHRAELSALQTSNQELKGQVEQITLQLDKALLKEKDLAGKMAHREREVRIQEAEKSQRIQELEIQLEAAHLAATAAAAAAAAESEEEPKEEKKPEEPTREELLAAMEAYRKKLEETDATLQKTDAQLEKSLSKLEKQEASLKKSEDRKAQLREDLHNLIAKSKEIERNAKQWKQRSENYEAKFAKTKELAREFSERSKKLEREKKAAAEEVEELKARVAKLEQRSQKAEDMAKTSVAVIKKSGNPQLKKELSLALQSLQTTKSVSVEAKAERRKSPRYGGEEGASPSSSAIEVKAERRKSPRVEMPKVVVGGATEERRSPRPDRKLETRGRQHSSPALKSPSTSPKASPRLEVVRSASEKGFLSPQVERKKNNFVQASAGGSKTPTVGRKRTDMLNVEPKSKSVMGSPQVRRANPGRRAAKKPEETKASSPASNDSAFDMLDALLGTEKKKAPATNAKEPSSFDLLESVMADLPQEEEQNAFDLLEDVLVNVEKDTGASGLSGAVDNSNVFEAGSKESAGDYLASMKAAAQAESAEQAAKLKEKRAKEAVAKAEKVQVAQRLKVESHRKLLSKYLSEERHYMRSMMKDPLHPLFALVPLLSVDKLQSEDEQNAILDAATDTDFVGNELVLKVLISEARDLHDSAQDDVFGIVSVKSVQQKTGTKALSNVIQWNEAFLFSNVEATSRVTMTIMSKKKRLGVAQINLAELRGTSKEYYPIVDNSTGKDSVIRGMLTASVSLHLRIVPKEPVTIQLDPNSKDYQDVVRHNVAKIKRCTENKPKEREFDATLTLNPVQLEMDKAKPNLKWIAQQIRAGNIAGDDPFTNVYRRSLLHLMCILGDVEMVEKCLAAGAEPKKRDAFGMFPFHLAIVYGHYKLLQTLLPVMRAFGQSVHTVENVLGLPPVHLAAIFNRPKILSWLLDQGAEPDDKDDFGGLPIHKAAFVGSLPCVQVLVNRRAFVKAEDIDGNTPILLAMMEGHWDVADYLLTNNVTKATWDTVNLAGENCLWFAVKRSNKRFTRMFLESRYAERALSEPAGPFQWSVLMRALNETDPDEAEDVVRLLIEALVSQGIGLNHRSSDGKNAAFIAAFTGNHNALTTMASRRLDLLAEDDNGNTPLHFAGVVSVVEVLIQAGANVNSPNRQGNTPLHAAYAFHPEVVDMLISHGANTSTRNSAGRTPIQCVGVEGGSIAIPYTREQAKKQPKAVAGLWIPK